MHYLLFINALFKVFLVFGVIHIDIDIFIISYRILKTNTFKKKKQKKKQQNNNININT